MTVALFRQEVADFYNFTMDYPIVFLRKQSLTNFGQDVELTSHGHKAIPDRSVIL